MFIYCRVPVLYIFSLNPNMADAIGGKIIQKNAHLLIRVLFWSGRRVSNPLPAAWKAAALPNELLPQGLRPFRNLCGGGWTRTTELRRGQIYSLLQLPLCDSPRKFRADRRTRTADRLITNQLLYQLSYIGLGLRLSFK